MIEDDNSESTGVQESTSDTQRRCCPASGDCCGPSAADSRGKTWKTLVFILIVIAAGVVLARSLMNRSDSISGEAQQAFAAIQPESRASANPAITRERGTESEIAVEAFSVTKDASKEEAPDKSAPTLLFEPLDSLASLNEVAADFDAVFIFLGGEDELNIQPVTKEIEAAANKIRAGGVRVCAFTLKKDSPNYAPLVKQFSIPCVLAMVKGRGASGVSGEITETRLIQAYVTASRAGSSCCHGSGGACAPGPGPIRSK